MWKFLSRWGQPVPFGYMVVAMAIWLCFGIDVAKADSQTAPTPVKSPVSIDGEIVWGISSYTGVIPTAKRVGSNTLTSDRFRLNIQTSLTGRDRLKIQFQSSSNTLLNSSLTGTNMTRSGYDSTKGRDANLSLLQYTFPLDRQTKLTIEVTGCGFSDNLANFNPLLASSGTGATSRFGRYNPIYRLSNDGTGITVDRQLSPELRVAISYSVPSLTAANPAPGNGILNNGTIIGQLSYHPSPDLDLGVTYAHSAHPNGSGVMSGTGSTGANSPFNGESTSANHYAFAGSYKLNPHVVISAWLGTTEARREVPGGGSAKLSNYAVTLAFPQLGGAGNTLGLVIGVPPKLLARSTGGEDRATSLHLEAFYKLKLSDNLDLTPSLLVITNPDHNSNNSTIYVGSVRTTFRF
jgi:Carbohydrate-selective porin, OprB family